MEIKPLFTSVYHSYCSHRGEWKDSEERWIFGDPVCQERCRTVDISGITSVIQKCFFLAVISESMFRIFCHLKPSHSPCDVSPFDLEYQPWSQLELFEGLLHNYRYLILLNVCTSIRLLQF